MIAETWNSLWNGAKEAARVATYWQMKKRAGVVGFNGLGPLLNQLHGVRPSLRVHLLGHSFGARLVAFALAKLPAGPASPVKSMTLIQGAFSHFAFTRILPHDLSRGGVLAGYDNRVDGPILVTHSVHDYAVGQFYPMASWTTNDDAAAFADPLFRYRGFGDDGAQAVRIAPPEQVHEAGVRYRLLPGTFLNLNCDEVIKKIAFPSGAHGDIIHDEIAWAVFSAAGLEPPPGAGAGALVAEHADDEGGVAPFPSVGVADRADCAPREAPAAPSAKTEDERMGVKVSPGAQMKGIDDDQSRRRYGVPVGKDDPGPYIVELNLSHYRGLDGAIARFEQLFSHMARAEAEKRIVSKTYYFCNIDVSDKTLLLLILGATY
jgi:hypothetical protein